MVEEDTKWTFYTNSEEAWTAMLLAILEAKESVDLEQFIFNYDSVGIKFLETLKVKAREGVKIRVFCDTVGSFSLARSGIETELILAGIEIRFFNGIFPWEPNNETIWYFRDHRKLMIVDKKIGFTGGVCLGDEMKTWRESHVRLEGLVVSQMSEAFDVMWDKTYRKFKYYLKRKKTTGNGAHFKYYTNAPLPGKRHLYRELVRAIRSAKHYIYLTTPYLLPDHRIARKLKQAAERGVEVRIIIPLKTDTKIVDIGASTFFNEFLKAGIRIFRYSASMIHSKTGVIDGSWSTIGSLNLDNLSLRYNFEANIVSKDRLFAFELERQFLNDLKISEELTLEIWKKRSIFKKILEFFVWPIRKLL